MKRSYIKNQDEYKKGREMMKEEIERNKREFIDFSNVIMCEWVTEGEKGRKKMREIRRECKEWVNVCVKLAVFVEP